MFLYLIRVATSISGGQRCIRRGIIVVRCGVGRGAESAPAAATTRAFPCALPALLPTPPARLLAAAPCRHAHQATG